MDPACGVEFQQGVAGSALRIITTTSYVHVHTSWDTAGQAGLIRLRHPRSSANQLGLEVGVIGSVHVLVADEKILPGQSINAADVRIYSYTSMQRSGFGKNYVRHTQYQTPNS